MIAVHEEAIRRLSLNLTSSMIVRARSRRWLGAICWRALIADLTSGQE